MSAPRAREQGKVSTYLMLPPDFTDDMPPGYIPVRSQTNNGCGCFFSLARGEPLSEGSGCSKNEWRSARDAGCKREEGRAFRLQVSEWRSRMSRVAPRMFIS